MLGHPLSLPCVQTSLTVAKKVGEWWLEHTCFGLRLAMYLLEVVLLRLYFCEHILWKLRYFFVRLGFLPICSTRAVVEWYCRNRHCLDSRGVTQSSLRTMVHMDGAWYADQPL